jgi:hypothetical protein
MAGKSAGKEISSKKKQGTTGRRKNYFATNLTDLLFRQASAGICCHPLLAPGSWIDKKSDR